VASVGLVKAVDRFDPERGIPFGAYASPTILGELRRHFRDTGWSVHVPRGDQERALAVRRVVDQLTDASGHSPTVMQIAERLDLSVEDTIAALETAQAHYADSLDAPAPVRDGSQGEAPSILDRTGGEDDGYGLVELSGSLAPALSRLPAIERQALVLRMREGLTQSQIAVQLGCSQMQVSRVLRRAAAHIREELAEDC
jgi:RNA polymerase sigma-B factor